MCPSRQGALALRARAQGWALRGRVVSQEPPVVILRCGGGQEGMHACLEPLTAAPLQ
jgi:hypothetical protein